MVHDPSFRILCQVKLNLTLCQVSRTLGDKGDATNQSFNHLIVIKSREGTVNRHHVYHRASASYFLVLRYRKQNPSRFHGEQTDVQRIRCAGRKHEHARFVLLCLVEPRRTMNLTDIFNNSPKIV